MAIYRYQHGDRPLEGYSIQHGLGRGTFGEVYYALSDSGREVALKSVQNYEDIELRGIKSCMNLKNQHLVSIFDIRHNNQEMPFVIMEFVDGPSLRQILDAHPEGLGAAKAAFFLKEIAKGLTYLHDCGVVHRDLKPHNVFYEQGVVKIGDYSLSKMITTSHRSGHTLTVGTVHYMAPEISMGRYDHRVDVYALGVLLYEMLTGHPPYLGDSMGEVLMKHMAGDVDLTGVDEPFAQVIKKALAKDPDQRYQSAEEMVADLFGSAEIQNSVAALGPESLTLVAEKAIRMPSSPSPVPPTEPSPVRHASLGNGGHDVPIQAERVSAGKAAGAAPVHGRKWHDRWKPFLGRNWPRPRGPVRDPLHVGHRFTLLLVAFPSLVVTFVCLGEMGIIGHRRAHHDAIGFAIALTAAGALASLIAQFLLLRGLDRESNTLFRLMHGMIVALPVMGIGTNFGPLRGAALAVSAAMFVTAWRVMASPLRPMRVSLELLAWPLGVTCIVAFFTSGGSMILLAVAIVAAIGLLVQLASPFDPRAAEAFWHQHGHDPAGKPIHDRESKPATYGESAAAVAKSEPAPSAPPPPPKPPKSQPVMAEISSHASPFNRLFALVLCALFFAFGIAGLQRFYVGRIRSGILWLLTFGFFGVGQVIDMVLIALGHFTDAEGRPVLEFIKSGNEQLAKPVNQYSSVLRDKWSESRIGVSLGNMFLNLVGGVLLVITLVLGVIVAVGLPEAFAVGVFGQDVAGEIAQETGIRDWYVIVNNVLAFVLVLVGTLAACCLLFARWDTTFTHMARVPLAAAGLAGCVALLGATTRFGDRWRQVASYVEAEMIGTAIGELFRHDFWPPLVMSCFVFIFSIFILAWPARRSVVPSSMAMPASAHEAEKQTA